MTIHVKYSHRCSHCTEEYLPFSEEQRPCPKCGAPADRVDPMIPEVVRAAAYNVRYGVFGVFSLGDWYVHKAMHVFWTIMTHKDLELPTDDAGLDRLVEQVLPFFSFQDCQHRIPHMKAFIREVIREGYLKGKG